MVRTTEQEAEMSRLNVGNADRALRIAIGIGLMALAASGSIGAWGYLGVVLLVTGVVAQCPLYALLGFATTSR
jgi:hypothetical protein